ncbi:MAG TPA: helix-turn-helix transcriptional regulator [Chitinophagaceae bacterium]
MENILMRFCRDTLGYTSAAVAANLGISLSEYQEIETGNMFLSEKQAWQLGKLFNVKKDYFYEAALQLDSLLAKKEIIKIQKTKIEELTKQIKDLQDQVIETK